MFLLHLLITLNPPESIQPPSWPQSDGPSSNTGSNHSHTSGTAHDNNGDLPSFLAFLSANQRDAPQGVDAPLSSCHLPTLPPTTVDANTTRSTGPANLPDAIDLTGPNQASVIDDINSSRFETPALASVIPTPPSETSEFIPVPKAQPEVGRITPPSTLKRPRADDLDDDNGSTPQNGKKRYFQDNHQPVPSDRPLSPLDPKDFDALLSLFDDLFSW